MRVEIRCAGGREYLCLGDAGCVAVDEVTGVKFREDAAVVTTRDSDDFWCFSGANAESVKDFFRGGMIGVGQSDMENLLRALRRAGVPHDATARLIVVGEASFLFREDGSLKSVSVERGE